MQLRVATLNLLSDLSRWEKRRPLLVKGFVELKPDLIALQEVSIPANNAYWLAGKLDFPHVFISPKTGREGEKEGVAILSRLPFEEQTTLDLRTQSRVAQYVQVRVGDHPVIFANGHFYWQPGEAARRQEQVKLLLSRLSAIPGDPAVIVCGDFNSTPDTPSIQLMKSRFLSAYAAVHGQEPEYTAPTPLPRSKRSLLDTLVHYLGNIRVKNIRLNWHGTLDYIFVSQRLRVIDCQLVLNQPAPGHPRLYPSDHFGLFAILETNP